MKSSSALSEAMVFFALTLGAAFLICWGPLALFQIPAISFVSGKQGPLWAILLYFIGGFVPSLAALFLTWRKEGKQGLRRLGRRVIQFNIGWRWYLATVLLIASASLVQILILRLLGRAFDPSIFIAQLGSFPFLILLGPLSEELGWRGYALDRLQSRFSPLVSSLIIGSIWALWHLPLFYLPGTSQHEWSLPFIPFLITLASQSILYTWLHNQTKSSIWTAVFFHWIYTCIGQVIFTAAGNFPSFHWYAVLPYILLGMFVAFIARMWQRHVIEVREN